MAAHPPSKRVLRASSPCASSGQATPRHMEWPAYRCFLPDLTGFAGFHCVGPDLQRRDTADSLAERPLGREFSPAVADCGYRAPLAPRLARPLSRLPARPGDGKRRGGAGGELRSPPGRPVANPCPPATVRRWALAVTCSPHSSSPWSSWWSWPQSRRGTRRGRGPPRRLPGEFSSARAMDVLRVVAAEPRPIGSPRSVAVRDFIYGRLEELALDPHVQTSEVVSAREPRVAGVVHNVVARLPGHDPSRAILLVAHYDSVPTAAGAADDGSGVAALLETARALRSGPSPRNDIIFLFTDGEERGLLGSQAFLRDEPWAYAAGVVLNFDSPGSSSPALMYETSPGNGLLISHYLAAGRRVRFLAHVRGLAPAAGGQRLPALRGPGHPGDDLRDAGRPGRRPHGVRLGREVQRGGPAARGRYRPRAGPPPRRRRPVAAPRPGRRLLRRGRQRRRLVSALVRHAVPRAGGGALRRRGRDRGGAAACSRSAAPRGRPSGPAPPWARRSSSSPSSGRCTAPPTRSVSGRAPASSSATGTGSASSCSRRRSCWASTRACCAACAPGTSPSSRWRGGPPGRWA